MLIERVLGAFPGSSILIKFRQSSIPQRNRRTEKCRKFKWREVGQIPGAGDTPLRWPYGSIYGSRLEPHLAATQPSNDWHT